MKKSVDFLFLRTYSVVLFCAAMFFVACSNGSDSPVTPSPSPSITSHSITIQNTENGSVTADKTSATYGETVTLTVAPNSGYELISLTVSSGNFTVYYGIEGTGSTRTFTMPSANVTVKGVFCAVVTLGEWPQTIKAAGVTVDENQQTTKGAFTYYKGSDNEWYAKQSEKACSSGIKYSDGTVVGEGGTSNKYFKVEPIKWRVLSTNYGGKKLLLANNALALCAYYDTKEERTNIHPNNYKESRVRAFLNGLSYNKSGTTNSEFDGKGFLQTAFTDSEQSSILTTTVDNSAASTACSGISPASGSACDNTDDKIFALSLNEATNSAYGFSSYNDSTSGNTRIIVASDYAKACGVQCYSNNRYGASWLLRSPVENGTRYYGVRICAGSGKISSATLDSDGGKFTGIVPSICVNN